jgi:hypothetical protein
MTKDHYGMVGRNWHLILFCDSRYQSYSAAFNFFSLLQNDPNSAACDIGGTDENEASSVTVFPMGPLGRLLHRSMADSLNCVRGLSSRAETISLQPAGSGSEPPAPFVFAPGFSLMI